MNELNHKLSFVFKIFQLSLKNNHLDFQLVLMLTAYYYAFIMHETNVKRMKINLSYFCQFYSWKFMVWLKKSTFYIAAYKCGYMSQMHKQAQ